MKMKKKANKVAEIKVNKVAEIKLNKAGVKNACKGIVSTVNSDKKNLKNERKTLRATIAFLAQSESVESETFRNFLNLKKGANKKEREIVCGWIEKRALYVTNKYIVTSDRDEVIVENYGILPCNKNGKIYSDMLDVIADVRKAYEKIIATRSEIARQMLQTRRISIAKNEYTETRKQNILNCVLGAPAKYQKQIRLDDTIIRK